MVRELSYSLKVGMGDERTIRRPQVAHQPTEIWIASKLAKAQMDALGRISVSLP